MARKAITKCIPRLRNFSIRIKMMVGFCLLSMLSLLLIAQISGQHVAAYSENTMRYNAKLSYEQAYTLLSYRVNLLIDSSNIIYMNDTIQTILKRNLHESDIIQQNADRLELDTLFYNLKATRDVYRICLYVPDWMFFSDQNINFSNMDLFRESQTYHELVQNNDVVLWSLPEWIPDDNFSEDLISSIPMYRIIRDWDNLKSVLGVVKINIQKQVFEDILFRADISRQGIVFLQNDAGEVVCSSKSEALQNSLLGNERLQSLRGKVFTWSRENLQGVDYLVNSQPIPSTGWNLMVLIPYSEILAPSRELKHTLLLLAGTIGMISCFFCYVLSTSMTSRLSLLVKDMMTACGGKQPTDRKLRNCDEIENLFQSYHYMMKRINDLINQRFLLGKELRNSEFKVLQAQINPHFLYNVLELIHWKAIDADAPEISEISQILARFYRTGLNQGKDIIQIKQEMEHLNTYVKLQNYRFENRVNLQIQLNEEVQNLYIPKMVLQPLLENAINHGILQNKHSSCGEVTIRGQVEDAILILQVIDNGIGMTEEQVQHMFEEPQVNKNYGYGVWNIQQRLQLYYGEEYGLHYQSTINQGTRVTLRIPARETSDPSPSYYIPET